jgi:hypothetical protein
MARSVSWLPRLDEIRRSVENSVRTHYERRDLELLFKLQPRAAGKLLSLLRTESPLGSSHLVTREELRKFLDAVSKAQDVTALVLSQRLQKQNISRRKPRSLVRRDLDPVGLASLPNWITLVRGRLTVAFQTTEQLAEGLLIMARIFESDGDEFAATYEPKKPSRDTSEAAADVRVLFDELEKMEGTHGR